MGPLSPRSKKLSLTILIAFLVHGSRCQDDSQDWAAQCKSRVLDAWQSKVNGSSTSATWPVLVDESGAQVIGLTPDDAWGISVDECYATCSDIKSTFQFANFSASFTNWLLPWLALIAQLPFETDGPFNDLMSILLAVGSPALITYSLVVTILNRSRIAERFKQLRDDASNSLVRDVYHHMIPRLDIACYIIQESQQTPMRVWEGTGWLSSLIIIEENQSWWESVKKSLASTRRGITTSLIAQNFFAVVAWLFTIIAAFDSLGDTTTALSISSSSIWLWMIPVITGWVAVGTQSDKGTVADALLGSHAPCFRAQNGHPADTKTVPAPKRGLQDGIRAVSGILTSNANQPGWKAIRRAPNDVEDGLRSLDLQATMSSEDRQSPPNSSVDEKTPRDTAKDKTPAFKLSRTPTALHPSSAVSHSPSIWSIALTGHENEEGPIYNYARVFTNERFAETVIYGFENVLRKIESGESPRGQWRKHDERGMRVDTHDNLAGTASQYHSFCGFDDQPSILENYPSWGAIPKKLWRHIIVASLMALFVQWGTTGPSLLIGLRTPTAGLGCEFVDNTTASGLEVDLRCRSLGELRAVRLPGHGLIRAPCRIFIHVARTHAATPTRPAVRPNPSHVLHRLQDLGILSRRRQRDMANTVEHLRARRHLRHVLL